MRYTTLAQPSIKVEAVARTTLPVSDTQPLLRSSIVANKNRILSVACYFGLAPFLWSSGVVRQQNRLLNHHLFYSLAFSFVLLCAWIFDALTTQIQYWIMLDLWNPTLTEFQNSAIPMWRICQTITYGAIISVCIFAAAWLTGVIGAWRGRTPHIPLISSLASNSKAVRLGLYWSLALELFLLVFIVIGIRSVQMAGQLSGKGDLYILYPKSGYVPVGGLYDSYTPPRWMITMAFYPLVRAGMDRFGDHAVSILPLTEASFKQAIHDGRFVFVASHGGWTPGTFTVSDQPHQEIGPSNVDPSSVGQQLQYMYFGGCWTGFLESDWRRVLGLDSAIMFNRISYVEEHLRWIWFKSPAVIRALK